ncbi:hypothetical protein J14TS2_33650 [Bacillus sp. J14TS2]|nr:hypothetical protein J14TS2_33650 [Bacillus sp. J14TS2]
MAKKNKRSIELPGNSKKKRPNIALVANKVAINVTAIVSKDFINLKNGVSFINFTAMILRKTSAAAKNKKKNNIHSPKYGAIQRKLFMTR